MQRFVAFACLLFCGALHGATTIRLRQLPSDVLLARLQRAKKTNRERHEELVKLFVETGCITTDLKVPHEDPDVLCVLAGDSDSVIFVGAHFDKVSDGYGVVDNWSGAALLPSLYQSLNVVHRRHTIVFMGFSGEEKGLLGSDYYIHHLPKPDRQKIHAMVAIDSLGVSPTKVWSSRADKELLRHLGEVSLSLKLPASGMNVDYVGDTDSSPFRDAHIPTITFHSLTNETFHILHSPDDTYAAIDQKAYVDSCHLITSYVAYLDEVLDPPAPPTQPATK
jgi:Iap family predicted aminopeptidase